MRLRAATILLLLFACNRNPVQELKRVARRARPAGPEVHATVVTLRTIMQPSNKTTTTSIVIADDQARATEETGEWRLFDLKENRVAFVNDFAKTYRYESFETLRERHGDAADQPFNEKVPRAQFASTGARRGILGTLASESVVKLGGYERHLWFGTHPQIPAQLFALMHASRSPSPDAPMTKTVDAALLSARGFPFADHSELPFANTKFVVDRDVIGIEQKNVQASLLDIPDEYKEVKPAPRPRPRPVAPPPPPPAPAATETTATTATTATTGTTDTTATTATTETTDTTATTATTEPEKKPVEPKKPEVKKAPAKKPEVKKVPAKKPEVKKSAPTKKTSTTKKTTTTKKTSTTKKPTTSSKKKSS